MLLFTDIQTIKIYITPHSVVVSSYLIIIISLRGEKFGTEILA
jgi:preprotein translocase subunit Sec61beta